MEIIFYLLGFSMLIALVFLASFVWAVTRGQFDDKHTPAMRILFDDTNKSMEE